MADRRTLAIYDAKAGDYAKLVGRDGPNPHLQRFLGMVATGGRVLDLGCGPGTASVVMRDAGFDPDPVDASAGMVAHAADTHGLPARQMTFAQLRAEAAYDGVWANFSLLHAPRSALPGHLAAISTALKPQGAFHVGMKTGAGEKRDGLGRQYTYVTAGELRDLLVAAGLTVDYEDTGAGKGLDGEVAPWVILQARKTNDA